MKSVFVFNSVNMLSVHSCLTLCAVLLVSINQSMANDFPSLLVANATMGVIIDHEYLGDEYESTLDTMKQIIERVIREDLRGAGLSIKYFSWSRINFNKDMTIIFSIASCKSTWETFFHARKERLLLLAITDPDCPRLPMFEALTIPRIKIGVELPQIILDIRTSKSVNWKAVTILYDDIFDRDTISRVANALTVESASMAMSISLLKLNSSTDLFERRENIKKSLLTFPNRFIGNNYLVVATTPTTILEVATEMDMIDSKSQWLFLVSNPKKTNISTLIPFIKEGGNVAIATNNTSSDDSTCAKTEECLYHELIKNVALSLSKLVREEEAIYGQISDEEWEAIRLTKRDRRDNMLEYIRDKLRNSPICTSCVKWKFEAAETWGLRFDNIQGGKLKDFKPIVTKAATWEPTNGLIMYDTLFPHITHGFRNRTIPIATYHNPPWQIITYSETGEVVGLRGISINILDELAVKLNFSYVVTNMERGSNNRSAYSYLDEFNVTSDGEIKATYSVPADVLESLSENLVLFGAIAITISENYEKYMNFTYPISVQSYGMLIPRPKELSRLYLFIAPFTVDTWLCLLLTIILIGPLLYSVNFISPYHEHHQITKHGGLFKIQNCFWYIYGALLQQGGMYLPKSDSGRIIVGTWWLVVLVVVTTYCGNLVAFLTFPKMEIPVSSVRQLVSNKQTYTWSVRSNSFLETFLKETDIEKYVKLNQSSEFFEQISNDTIKRVRKGKHIIIDWQTNLMHIMRREYLLTDRCDFTMSSENFLDEKIGMVLPSNSPYLNIFNEEIYRMLQMGFIQKWLAEYMPKKDRCSSSMGSMEIVNHTVNLIDMQGCFLVLIAGIIASIFIISVEFCCHKRKLFLEKRLIKPFVK